MSDGFNNPLVGGVGKLIREFIQSPNFVSGVSGWTVNKDGTVEFNAGTFRGTIIITPTGDPALLIYDGAPALGTLIVAVSGVEASDSFGNAWGVGITFYGTDQNGAGRFWMPTRLDPDTNHAGYFYSYTDGIGNNHMQIAGPGNFPGFPSGATLSFKDDATLEISAGQGPVDFTPGLIRITEAGIKFGANGLIQQPYAEQLSYSLPAQASGAIVFVNGGGANTMTVDISDKDYPSGWALATGTFTPPVEGYYDFNAVMNAGGATTERLMRINVNGNIEAQGVLNGRTFVSTSLVAMRLLPTDAVTFLASQTSAANQTISGRIKVRLTHV